MRKLLFIMAVSALILSSCGTKKAEQKEGTHVHADGTVHEAHEHEAPSQEAFEVKEHDCSKCSKDSCATKEECTTHEEKHQHDHDHEHGHDHDHN
ncbi:hypothetical protein [Carboxylicivirga sp. RSCT41]|uniref:hypothetical protein n=1 Tax=Carboxylicivirga agarovorans TaxID=3417570 RepID=UPI003D338F26